jgi:repressor LexA
MTTARKTPAARAGGGAGLTKRQGEVLEFVLDHQGRTGAPPTLREICTRFGFSSDNAAREHLRLIERKGAIRRLPGVARGARPPSAIPVQFHGTVRVPLVGRVQAGRPVTAVEQVEGFVALDRNMFQGNGLFALRVRGDSMKGAGIHEGDLVIVREQADASQGDIVVALLGDEATVKRYQRPEGGGVVLHAENPVYEDIAVDSASAFSVLGKVIGVIRKM